MALNLFLFQQLQIVCSMILFSDDADFVVEYLVEPATSKYSSKALESLMSGDSSIFYTPIRIGNYSVSTPCFPLSLLV